MEKVTLQAVELDKDLKLGLSNGEFFVLCAILAEGPEHFARLARAGQTAVRTEVQRRKAA
jgi:hypothetical protein